MTRYNEKTVFNSPEIEIIQIQPIGKDIKHLNSYRMVDKFKNTSVFIHYNYMPSILRILNENKQTNRP